MSVMDRVAGILADAGSLLQDADDLTVEEALLNGEAPDSRDWRTELSCGWCGHNWHGLGCYVEGKFDRARDSDLIVDSVGRVVEEVDTWALQLSAVRVDGACRCDGSRQRLDDTWRPNLFTGRENYTAERVRKLANDLGLDGWAAQAVIREGRERAFRSPVLRPGAGWAVEASASLQAVGEAFQEAAHALSSFTVSFTLDNPSPEVIRTLTGYSAEPPPPAFVDLIARARAGRGTGPERAGPERSRPPRRIN